jgi:uncharacterized membrane protein
LAASKKYGMYAMVVLYVIAGINHFINPQFYLKIMPPYVPYHLAMVYASGVCEVLFVLMLIPQKTRKAGAWLLILMLIAIFPANIQMTINWYATNHSNAWVSLVRLPIQIVLIWWAYLYTKNDN